MMKRVTKSNLLKLIELKKAGKTIEANNFILNVINRDRHYFKKLSSYDFNNEQLKYLM